MEKTGKKKFVRQDIIKAAQLDQNESLNINMVADASGSMQGSPLTSAKSVIAFTDGKDNYSKCKPDDVIEIAKKYKIPVFIIGIGSSTIDSDVQRICSETGGLSEPEKLMKEYLPACVKAINNHDFSYIEKYMVKDGPVYKENKEYIKNNFTEEFLSCKIIDIKYPTKDSCIVHLTETYKIQNNKEPLHMRTLESYYKLLKQSDGSWQVYSYPKDMKVIKKIRY